MQGIILALILASLQTTVALSHQNCHTTYTSINGNLCIRNNFTKEFSNCKTNEGCAILCSKDQRCQAFTTNDGPCQLFVFDKCSKSVRNCSCTKRGQLFVKNQQGLQPGALCPSDYGDDLCGVKYKLYNNSGRWWPSRQKCENESGLVIMADVADATEMSHVDMLYTKYSNGTSFWLGGYQIPGSVEPTGGWYWVGCNITLDSNLWAVGQPNDQDSKENTIGRSHQRSNLTDFREGSDTPKNVLCECLSPFG